MLLKEVTLAAVLRNAGYGVVTASDGMEALVQLRSGPAPDLVLLDMLMPVLDGWRLLERIKETPAGAIPVIITTGTILTKEWAAMKGCAGFIKKPVEEQDLLDELRSVLAP